MAGKLVIFTAPSGAGKTTIVHEMLKVLEFNLAFSVSATTRPPRPGEKDGVDYYFISKEEFLKKIENNEFVEWNEVYDGIYYGTLKTEIERLWKLGKNVVFDVDVVGAMNIKKQYPDKSLAIFIKPPSLEELKRRLEKRGTETPEQIQKRLERAKYELQFADKFDVVIVNDDLQKAVEETKKILREFLLSK